MNFHEEKLKKLDENIARLEELNLNATSLTEATIYSRDIEHYKKLKLWLSQYHRDYNDFLVKKIEEMKADDNFCYGCEPGYCNGGCIGTRNDAVKEFISLIKSENHE